MQNVGTAGNSFAKQANKMGVVVKLSKVITKPPVLRRGLQLYLDAYFDLDSDRPALPSGFARIPWSVINSYAKAFSFSSDQFQELMYMIRELDKIHPGNKKQADG